jgi:hypothetical protein
VGILTGLLWLRILCRGEISIEGCEIRIQLSNCQLLKKKCFVGNGYLHSYKDGVYAPHFKNR